MMQQHTPCQTNFDPGVADIALDIDATRNSITLSGTQYQFKSAVEMENFLRTLWDTEIPDNNNTPT